MLWFASGSRYFELKLIQPIVHRSISGNENDGIYENDEIYEYDPDLVDRAPGYEMQYEDFNDDNFTGGYFLNPLINMVFKYR